MVNNDSLREKILVARKQIAEVNNITRTLVLFDLHIPFHREQVILDIVEKHKHEIDTIILGGDVVDCEGISSFPKEIRRPLIQEMIIAYKFLKKIDKMTPNIKKILIWGNHEYRFVRYLENKGNELNPFHSNNILYNIIGGFTHHDRVEKKKVKYPALSDNFEIVDKWYVRHYDMIVAHPKNFSRVKLRTAHQTLEHFMAKGWQFKAVWIGHTHKWGNSSDKGIWFGESGCLCLPMDYSDTGNVNYTPQEYGYLLATFVNGEIDRNLSQHHWLDVEDGEEIWQEDEDQ